MDELRPQTVKFGANLYAQYLAVCEDAVSLRASVAGYELKSFGGYYTGHSKQMTHFAAELIRTCASAGPS